MSSIPDPDTEVGFFEQTAKELGELKDPKNWADGVIGAAKGAAGLPWDILQLGQVIENKGRDALGWMIGRDIPHYEGAPEKPKILEPSNDAQRGGDKVTMILGAAGLVKGVAKQGIKVTKKLAKASDEAADAAVSGNARGKRLLDKQTAKGHPDLPQSEAVNFQSADPDFIAPGEKLYRVQGGNAGPGGAYYTKTPPSSLGEFRSQNAVRESWNSASEIQEITAGPNGMRVWTGPTASQNVSNVPTGFHYPGGGQQVWVPPGEIGSVTNVTKTNW